jgi:hypothetical protein
MSTGGAVFRLVLTAILVAGGAAFANGRMDGEEITNVFSGATLQGVYFDGSFFTEEYRRDGTIGYHDAEHEDAGRWSVRNDTFCTFYDDREGACFFVVRQGKNCFSFFEQKLGSDGTAVPREEWTSQGWLRSEPSTCTITRDETI